MNDELMRTLMVIAMFGSFILGISVGAGMTSRRHADELDAVGIREIRHCHAGNTDISSNWYEIVWKDMRK